VFAWLARMGGVDADEMLRVFNCGLGMVLVVTDPDAARDILEAHGEKVFSVGRIEAGPDEPAVDIMLPAGWPA
jgi:phosphoribosylformylglycinamidine cyclo-ligase